ncbi:hypothetical protein GALL_82090 [mine drainage metagenome]|uniref:Uncharacterized protein n=1 Tax=mine drainage metagenome TaxID=410659 RepID=A0A1J5SPA1_9ZZZZ
MQRLPTKMPDKRFAPLINANGLSSPPKPKPLTLPMMATVLPILVLEIERVSVHWPPTSKTRSTPWPAVSHNTSSCHSGVVL